MRVLGVLLVVLVVAACAPAAPPAPTRAPGALDLPARPFDVRIDGVDPCSLLTDEQRAELGLDQPPVFDTGYSDLYRGEVPACTTVGQEPRAVSGSVAIVTTAGIELFASGEITNAQVSAATVAGFPAVEAKPDFDEALCTVLVDVAPGQMLILQFSHRGRPPAITQEQMCQDAQALGELAMTTLQVTR